MSSIQCITNNEVLVVDSRLIAEELEIQHESLIKTIKKYQDKIERFGQFGFEIDTVTNSVGAVNQTTFCYFNEDQATFIMTLSRNTEKVVNCKLKLVQAFKEAKLKIDAENQAKIPQTYIEALKALVASEEAKELLKAENELLEKENHTLAEAVDELFDYSSIIRIAKFNKISEKNFNWHTLKVASIKLGKEIKQVPCPRFVTKNLYSHDAWRLAYPKVSLPETTTLVIQQ